MAPCSRPILAVCSGLVVHLFVLPIVVMLVIIYCNNKVNNFLSRDLGGREPSVPVGLYWFAQGNGV